MSTSITSSVDFSQILFSHERHHIHQKQTHTCIQSKSHKGNARIPLIKSIRGLKLKVGHKWPPGHNATLAVNRITSEIISSAQPLSDNSNSVWFRLSLLFFLLESDCASTVNYVCVAKTHLSYKTISHFQPLEKRKQLSNRWQNIRREIN